MERSRLPFWIWNYSSSRRKNRAQAAQNEPICLTRRFVSAYRPSCYGCKARCLPITVFHICMWIVQHSAVFPSADSFLAVKKNAHYLPFYSCAGLSIWTGASFWCRLEFAPAFLSGLHFHNGTFFSGFIIYLFGAASLINVTPFDFCCGRLGLCDAFFYCLAIFFRPTLWRPGKNVPLRYDLASQFLMFFWWWLSHRCGESSGRRCVKTEFALPVYELSSPAVSLSE